MATIATPTDESHRDVDNTLQYQAVGPPDDIDAFEVELSLIQALDHLEALRLFEHSGVPADPRFDDALVRSDTLIRAMDAAAELCGLGASIETTIPVRFTRQELSLLALAHSEAAAHYREEGFPDTAANYHEHKQQILLAVAERLDEPEAGSEPDPEPVRA